MSVTYEEQAGSGLAQLGLTVAQAQLDTACQQAAASQWSYSHFLGYLLAGEVAARHQRTVALNLQFARFPYLKRLQEFDYGAQPGVDRRLVEELATATEGKVYPSTGTIVKRYWPGATSGKR